MSVTTRRALDPGSIRFGEDGLVPAIVQDRADGRVLMLGHMDAEALAATRRTGEVHFHSRSRGRLWRKGETSGNTLRLLDIATDCDRDALLITAEPAGPTCHTGTRSCFDDHDAVDAPVSENARQAVPGAGVELQGFAWLETLWQTISERASTRPPGSYTASLLEGGVDAVARKVAEEATEVVIAAKDDAAAGASASDRQRTHTALAAETADLLYHALVLLAERGVSPRDVIADLRARHVAPTHVAPT